MLKNVLLTFVEKRKVLKNGFKLGSYDLRLIKN